MSEETPEPTLDIREYTKPDLLGDTIVPDDSAIYDNMRRLANAKEVESLRTKESLLEGTIYVGETQLKGFKEELVSIRNRIAELTP